jgi:hypothetical protein
MKANESSHIVKAREKLKNQLERKDKLLTQQALERIRKTMHSWIARHASERISLKSKDIKLFDENRHPAKIENKFILNKLKSLKIKTKIPAVSPLTGRIKQQ